MGEFSGKKVLVTGGASGIGRATALAFAREGAELVLVDMNEQGLDSVAREIESLGGTASRYAADLSDSAQVEELHRKVIAGDGTPDVLMNAAGIAMVGCTEEVPLEVWERVLAVNLMGYIYVIHFFLPDMIRKGGGHIVNVASGAGLFGMPYEAPYTTSKFGVVGLSEVLRWELDRHGIRVSAVCPGAINTPIIETAECFNFNEESVKKGGYLIAASADRMAVAILKGVRKNRAVIIFPYYIRVIWGLKRFSPRLGDFAGKLFAKVFYWQHRK